MNTEKMCIDARQRVSIHINRSAGQHSRAMKAAAVQPDSPSESDIYAMGMEGPTGYKFAAWLCKQAGVNFPPKLKGDV